jgi:hypothetical protein
MAARASGTTSGAIAALTVDTSRHQKHQVDPILRCKRTDLTN